MRYVPLRSRLLLLAVAGILPLAVLSRVGLVALIHQQRSEAERTSLDVARALATAVDAELRRSIWGLEVLATSPQLDTGNTSAFEVRARRVLATGSQWRAIFLADADGTVLMNASEPGGGDDTQTLDMEGFARVVKSRSPAIGQLVRDQREEYGVEVHLPVMRAGDLRFILSCVVKPDVIREVINRQRVPENWVISVFDAKGLRVARSRAHEQFIGTPASPSLRQLMAGSAPEGTGFTYALEGDFIQTAYTRLAESGRSVAIGIAPTALVAGVYSSLAAYGGGHHSFDCPRRAGSNAGSP